MVVGVGDILGEYRLLRVIGEGAFCTVFLAEHILITKQLVAIKVLSGTLTATRWQRFQNEANRQASLDHRHVVQFFFYSEDPLPYLVMKYAPHGTLEKRYPLGTLHPLNRLLPHISQIARGLQYIHDNQILHLDLKPDNVLLGLRKEALISDFGFALLLHAGSTQATVDRMTGTFVYSAPEIYERRVAKESDQYALATMVYQWLAGRLPYAVGLPIDVQALVLDKLDNDPPPLREFARVSPSVEAVVMRALSRSPAGRFESVRQFMSELRRAARDD